MPQQVKCWEDWSSWSCNGAGLSLISNIEPKQCFSSTRVSASRQTLTKASESHMDKTILENSSPLSPQTPHHPLWLSLSVSPLLFAAVSVQTISLCMLNKHFSFHCPGFYKSMLSNYLVLEFVGPTCSCFAFYFLFGLCHGEGAPVSEGPPHPYQWLPFIWCYSKCRDHLSGTEKCGNIAKSIELKWNYFSWGREPLHFTGLLNCLDAVRAYIF